MSVTSTATSTRSPSTGAAKVRALSNSMAERLVAYNPSIVTGRNVINIVDLRFTDFAGGAFDTKPSVKDDAQVMNPAG
jgi:hypothetical protein